MNKPMPQNIEFEESVLSYMLLGQDLDHLFDNIGNQHFYRTQHQTIFSAGLDLHRKRQRIEAAAVLTALKDAGADQETCGASFLFKLMNDCPAPVNLVSYCERLKQVHAMRETINRCHEIMDACHSCGDNAEEILSKAQSDILAIEIDGANETFTKMSDLTHASLDRYEEVRDRTIDDPVYTGFHVLDRVTGGLIGPRFIVISARPGVGKTAFMLNMARHMGESLAKVGIFSIEMPKEELDDRLFAMESGINSMAFTKGNGANEDQMQELTNAAAKKYQWPMLIDDTGGININELCRRAKKMRKEGVEIIFIDQLSKIRGGEGNSRFEKKSNIVERIDDLKKSLGIPIVLLAQINRKVGDRADKKPTLSDLKDTGQLEEDADIVILLHLEDDKKTFSANIAKHRQGAIYNVPLIWDAQRTLFHNVTSEY